MSRRIRRFQARHRTTAAVLSGTIAVLPAALACAGSAQWFDGPSPAPAGHAALQGGYDPGLGTARTNVNGTLPDQAEPPALGTLPAHGEALAAYELPAGPLGIPGTALRAYRNAADVLGREQPGCGIDWALIASIGRIESNHARGGYVDARGNTLEPILGPVLNGVGPVAAIPDTDGGRYDRDTVWDRAVGPTQFIPSTWRHYAADGNGDGKSDPNNIYDATVATGRYLCSGGFDLREPAALRAAVFRYNNSAAYVATVIRWAHAYRSGVTPTADSDVPIGAPNPGTSPGPGPVPPPPPGPDGPEPSPSPTPTPTPSPTSTPPTSTSDSTPPTPPTSTPSPTPSPTTAPTTTPSTSPPESTSCPPEPSASDSPCEPEPTSQGSVTGSA